jgi:hypothetical protein
VVNDELSKAIEAVERIVQQLLSAWK